MSSEQSRICVVPSFSCGPALNWPIALGRKGPTWFAVYTTPKSMSVIREHLPLNALLCSDHAPTPSPESRARFVFFCPMDPGILQTMLRARVPAPRDGGAAAGSGTRPVVRLTGRQFGGGAVELEVLLADDELLYACAHCEKWEMVGRPRFDRCGDCKERFYCSTQCRHADRAEHQKVCGLLRAGQHAAAEAIERKHVAGMAWQIRYMDITNDYPAARIDGRDFYLPGCSYGVHIPPRVDAGAMSDDEVRDGGPPQDLVDEYREFMEGLLGPGYRSRRAGPDGLSDEEREMLVMLHEMRVHGGDADGSGSAGSDDEGTEDGIREDYWESEDGDEGDASDEDESGEETDSDSEESEEEERVRGQGLWGYLWGLGAYVLGTTQATSPSSAANKRETDAEEALD